MKSLYLTSITFLLFFTLNAQSAFIGVNNSQLIQTNEADVAKSAVVNLVLDSNSPNWNWTGPDNWTGNGNNVFVTNFNQFQAGTYTAISGQGESVSFTLNFLPSEFADFQSDRYVCGTQDVTLDAPALGHTYLWSTGETTPFIIVNSSQESSYHLTITTEFGFQDVSTVNVLNTAGQTINLNETTCSPTLTGPAGFDYYNWSNGVSNQTTALPNQRDFNLVLEAGMNDGCTTTFSYNITNENLSAEILSVNPPMNCTNGGDLRISLLGDNIPEYPISLIGGYLGVEMVLENVYQSNATIELFPGQYDDVRLVSQNECTFNLGSITMDSYQALEEQIEIFTCEITTSLNAPDGYQQYLWENGETDQLNTVHTGQYPTISLQTIDENGCEKLFSYSFENVSFSATPIVTLPQYCGEFFLPYGDLVYKPRSNFKLRNLGESN